MSALWHVGAELGELICVRADDAEEAAVAFVRTHDAANDFVVANGAPISVYVRADGSTEYQLVEVFGGWSPTYVGYARAAYENECMKHIASVAAEIASGVPEGGE